MRTVQYIYMYIYIYICVCVCVCVCSNNRLILFRKVTGVCYENLKEHYNGNKI